MSFNISDFILKDIIHTAKGKIENNYFKVTIENVDYPALISRIGTTLLEIRICCIKRQVDEENPIEKKIIEFNNIIKNEDGHDYLFEEYGKYWDVDFIDSEKFYFYPNFDYIFNESNFEFTDINEKTRNYLNLQIQKEEVTCLLSSEIDYNDLENPNSEFKRRMKRFICKKCIKEYNNDINLQNDLIEVKKNRIEYEKEKEKHMQEVKDKERKIQEYNNNLEVPKRKNLKDYNIR